MSREAAIVCVERGLDGIGLVLGVALLVAAPALRVGAVVAALGHLTRNLVVVLRREANHRNVVFWS